MATYPLITSQQSFDIGPPETGSTLELPQRWRPNAQPGGTVSPAIIEAVIRQESSGHPEARGKKGEYGLMQITPAVAQQYGVPLAALSDPKVNRWIGTRYLNDLMKQFGGNLPLALAAYNAGPARVRNDQIPDSTHKYVRKILETIGVGVEKLIGEGEAYGGEEGSAWSHARKIDDPWSGGRTVADPWKTEAAGTPSRQPTKLEQYYEKYLREPGRRGVRGLIERGPAGLVLGPRKEGGAFAESVANLVVPPNLTQAGIQAAMMASGLGELGLAGRLALPAVGGATGAYLEDKSPIIGAGEGLLSQGAGEIAGLGLGVAGRLVGKKGLLESTSREVGEEIGSAIPTMGAAPKAAGEMEELFTRGGIVERVRQTTNPTRDQIRKIVRGIKFDMPVMTRGAKIKIEPMELTEAEDALTKLGDLGYTKGGGIKTAMASREARTQAYAARARIGAKLNSIKPGMGDTWLAVRRQIGAAQAIKRLFQDNPLFDPATGQVDQPRLVRAILDNWDDLSRNLGVDGAAKLLATARRGARLPVSDRPSQLAHLRLRPEMVYSSIPRTYRGVGNVPWYMKGSSYRLPAGIAATHEVEPFGGAFQEGE